MAKSSANGSNGNGHSPQSPASPPIRPKAPPGGFRHGGKTYRAGRPLPKRYAAVVAGEPITRDADGLPNVPPGFGRWPVQQVTTHQGQFGVLAHVYRSPDEALRHSVENARFMRNDCSVMECLEARQRGTALLPWHVEVEDKKDPKQKHLSEALTRILKNIPFFTEYRRNLLEALWYGRYACQHTHGFLHGADGKRYAIVNRWLPINGDKLVFRYDDGSGKFTGDEIGVRTGMSWPTKDAVNGDKHLEPADGNGMVYFLKPQERSRLVVHKHIIEDGSFETPISAGRIHGVGIRDRIYWTWYQKQETMAALMEIIQRTGAGFTIYYFPHGNQAAENKVRELAIENQQANTLFVPRMAGDPSMDAYGIERIEPSSVGIEAMRTIIHEFFGHQIKRYILGQILSSESAATGLGSGVADLHMASFTSIIQYDASKLEETITTELLRPLQHINFRWADNIQAWFRISVGNDESEKVLAAYRTAWEMGAKIKTTDVMDAIGASMPEPTDEVLVNPQIAGAMGQGQPGVDGAGGGDAGQPNPLANLVHHSLADGATDALGGDREDGRDGPGENEPPEPWQYTKDGQPLQYAAAHAPKGGVTIQGKEYKGGEFIPAEVVESATAEEKAAIEGKGKPDSDDDDEPFTLTGKPKHAKPEKPAKKPKEKQGKLFAGTDDSPGQESFFDDIDPGAKNVGEQGAEKPDELLEQARDVRRRIPFVSVKGMAKQLGIDDEERAARLLEEVSKPATSEQGNPPGNVPDATPREVAESASKQQLDDDYAFARKSAVPNAGEDLLGSARHKRNAWRGLADAEENGTAEELVTRENLLKNEPHDLVSAADTNPLTALAMHYALRKFPAKPGYGDEKRNARRDEETKKKDRRQFHEAFQSIRQKADELAAGEPNPDKAAEALRSHIGELINLLRGAKSNEYMHQATATDAYNNTANALVNLHKSLSTHRAGKLSVGSQVREFGAAFGRKYGNDPSKYGDAERDAICSHAQDIIEGKSLNSSFGAISSKPGREVFSAADQYVKHATRKGGRVIDANTVKAATSFMMDTLKMRGIQHGNSVTDDERQHHLQKASEAFADLSDAIGLSDHEMSLGGQLGIAFGARGKGTASAHYEPSSRVVNLTRTNGVGTLAHEWGHFFDHSLTGFGLGSGDADYMSDHTWEKEFRKDEKGDWIKDEKGQMKVFDVGEDPIPSAYRQLRQSWQMSGFKKRLSQAISEDLNAGLISEKKAKYWGSNREVFARCFERYVQFKLAESGRENTYLSGMDKGHKYWPTDAEVKSMAPAFDAIFDAYKQNGKEGSQPTRYEKWITIGGREQLNLTLADINRLENQGIDYGSKHKRVRGLDTVGREMASLYPSLGWGEGYGDEAGHDYAENVWELIKEGKQELPSRVSREYHDVVDEYLEGEMRKFAGSHPTGKGRKSEADKRSDALRKEMEHVEFKREGEPERYGTDAHGHEHAPAGSSDGGQFVSKGGRFTSHIDRVLTKHPARVNLKRLAREIKDDAGSSTREDFVLAAEDYVSNSQKVFSHLYALAEKHTAEDDDLPEDEINDRVLAWEREAVGKAYDAIVKAAVMPSVAPLAQPKRFAKRQTVKRDERGLIIETVTTEEEIP